MKKADGKKTLGGKKRQDRLGGELVRKKEKWKKRKEKKKKEKERKKKRR